MYLLIPKHLPDLPEGQFVYTCSVISAAELECENKNSFVLPLTRINLKFTWKKIYRKDHHIVKKQVCIKQCGFKLTNMSICVSRSNSSLKLADRMIFKSSLVYLKEIALQQKCCSSLSPSTLTTWPQNECRSFIMTKLPTEFGELTCMPKYPVLTGN